MLRSRSGPCILRRTPGSFPRSRCVPSPICCTQCTLQLVWMCPATRSGTTVLLRCALRCASGSCSSGAFRRSRVSRAGLVSTSTPSTRGMSSTSSFHVLRKWAFNNSKHEHLICQKCGKVEEFYDEKMGEIVEEMAESRDFTINHHLLYI